MNVLDAIIRDATYNSIGRYSRGGEGTKEQISIAGRAREAGNYTAGQHYDDSEPTEFFSEILIQILFPVPTCRREIGLHLHQMIRNRLYRAQIHQVAMDQQASHLILQAPQLLQARRHAVLRRVLLGQQVESPVVGC